MGTRLFTETQSGHGWKQCRERARGVCRINSAFHVRYADARTQRKCGWSGGSIRVAVSSIRLRTRNSRSAARASSRVQPRTCWIVRTPSACRPCSVSTGPRFTSASQTSCSCSGDISQVYNASEAGFWTDYSWSTKPGLGVDVTEEALKRLSVPRYAAVLDGISGRRRRGIALIVFEPRVFPI